MAQNITIMGASYSNVPAVQLPKTGGGTARFDDASVTTATASDVASGKVFLASDGTITTGTSSGGGGGSSSWTKVAETSYQVSTTGTSAATVATWATGHSEIWTSDKVLYIRIRDTAGKRAGYFYGCDAFFINMFVENGDTKSNTAVGIIESIWSYSTDNAFEQRYGQGTAGYGIYPSNINKSGGITISKRYNATYSKTIDGIYKVEVYLLDPAGGVPIFE